MQRPTIPRLTDEELTIISDAARPLDPDDRSPFLETVFAALVKCDAIGPGTLFVICRDAQRQHLTPPIPDDRPSNRQGVSKYARDTFARSHRVAETADG